MKRSQRKWWYTKMYLHEFFWTSSTTPSCLMLVPQEAKCLNLSLCQKLYNINYYIKQFIFFLQNVSRNLSGWRKLDLIPLLRSIKVRIKSSAHVEYNISVLCTAIFYGLSLNRLQSTTSRQWPPLFYFTVADTSSLVLTSYDSLLPTVQWPYSHVHVPLSPRWSSDCGQYSVCCKFYCVEIRG